MRIIVSLCKIHVAELRTLIGKDGVKSSGYFGHICKVEGCMHVAARQFYVRVGDRMNEKAEEPQQEAK